MLKDSLLTSQENMVLLPPSNNRPLHINVIITASADKRDLVHATSPFVNVSTQRLQRHKHACLNIFRFFGLNLQLATEFLSCCSCVYIQYRYYGAVLS